MKCLLDDSVLFWLRMLSPTTTTILSFVVVIVNVLSFSPSRLYPICRSKFLRITHGEDAVISSCSSQQPFPLPLVFPSSPYMWMTFTRNGCSLFTDRLVYQGDHAIIRHLMSMLIVVYAAHTLLIMPFLAVWNGSSFHPLDSSVRQEGSNDLPACKIHFGLSS